MPGETRDVPLRPGFLPREAFQRLLDLLRQRGYRCVGPVVEDGAIVYREVARAAQFPAGVGQEQAPGRYCLTETGGDRLFAWANGPQALKPLVFAPHETLWSAARGDGGALRFEGVPAAQEPLAVIGVRACDLAALALQDRHFLGRDQPDPWYQARRERLLLVGVDCTHPADTCFCASTGDGPALEYGYDLGLSELTEGFLVLPGNPLGSALLADLDLEPATLEQLDRASGEVMEAAAHQSRVLPSRRLRDELYGRLDDGRWQQVAQRCLACGNCTSVCPTCYCFRAAQEGPLDGRQATQVRVWDSCFNRSHGSVRGHVIRANVSDRYRQWLTHKLAGWHDQFGRSGCVGCGRCISWCPAGIDLTEEAAALCLEGDHV